MLVNLIMKNSISTVSLPQKISGRFWISSECTNGTNEHIAAIDAAGKSWQITLQEGINFNDDTSDRKKSFILEDKVAYYALTSATTNEDYLIFIEPSSNDRKYFQKYAVDGNAVITIGRNKENDICFQNQYVSSNHAEIHIKNSRAIVSDLNSSNGTYVNGEKIVSSALEYGDLIFVCGLRIIVLSGFIAVNNPDGNCVVTLKKYNVQLQTRDERELIVGEKSEEKVELDFFRSPRFKRSIRPTEIKVDVPPQSEIDDEMPILLTLAPAATMGIASMTSAAFALNSAISRGSIASAVPTLMMALCMLTGMVLWPSITKKIDKKRKLKRESIRQEKYIEYLNNINQEIKAECSIQQDILRENYSQPSECFERIKNIRRTLWERTYGQDDFLCVRLGSGELPLDAVIEFSPRKFSIKNDNLLDSMYKLCESPKILSDVPITHSIRENRITGVVGKDNLLSEYSKNLILQIVALHSYDEVKLIALTNDDDDNINYIKWLPHIWNEDRSMRFLASNESELKEISAYLEKEIENNSENEAKKNDNTPYYVVVSFNQKLSMKSDLLKKIYIAKKAFNFSVIHFVNSIKYLPKECETIIEITEKTGKLIKKNDISSENKTFSIDSTRSIDMVDLSHKLSNICLSTQDENSTFPSLVTFLQMFGAGKVEHLNCVSRWKENDPTQSLETPIGVDAYGDTFLLDLHEKFHGPHGLVAGMTGSGKSEFIMTYILSLAVNYHPNEVAFILIDYKGGGMAKAFENLPHVAGIITNLDGAAVRRSLVSIESELKRRQAMFVDASKKISVSNIDIYKYQRLYRDGVVSEPLQHLFIISDEFAELKTQQPEFMTQLISTARIGRSLGVHLILATQKPSGVVDDQIWSNSKFRICLKVQERADSMDMLKRPDAAELKATGRFFLQVGYNELFSVGQSAWAGASYNPSELVETNESIDVEIIDKLGRVIKQAKIETKKASIGQTVKQLDAVTKYIKKIADDEHVHIKPLWLAPLSQVIELGEIRSEYGYAAKKYKLCPIIGECDAPATQSRFALTCQLSAEGGNVIVNGISGSGKTTFITTLLYSLIIDHAADEVNIYVVDFGTETLTCFREAPQAGEVILSYEKEKVDNLFKMLQSELETRKRQLSEYGGDYYNYAMKAANPVPQIVVVINNYSAFSELQEEKDEIMQILTREGTKYGIYFVLSATGAFGVRFKLAQNFKQLFVLAQNENSDYTSLLGRTEGLYPSSFPGRGLVKTDAVYEFQTAIAFAGTENSSKIVNICRQLAFEWKGKKAKPINILPNNVNAEYMKVFYSVSEPLKIPIGVNCITLDNCIYDLSGHYISYVVSSTNGYIGFFNSITELMRLSSLKQVWVFDAMHSLKVDTPTNINVLLTAEQCEKAVRDIFDITVSRHREYKEALKNNSSVFFDEPVVLMINSYFALRDCLSEDARDKMCNILEKGNKNLNIEIVIGEQAKSLSQYNYEKWYKLQVPQGDGIWIGSGIAEQFAMKPLKYTNDMYEDLGDSFGYLLSKGKAVKLKVLSDEYSF